MRRVAALFSCAVIAFGQGTASETTTAPAPWVIDAVVVDAAGRPVTDLTADDFEVVHGGRAQKIANFTWFDTRLHAAISRSGEAAQLPALDLVPDEIRRNLVVIVDDLGLKPSGINAVHTALKAFVGGSMGPGDRMAILRSSGGGGVLQQLTGDTRILVNAIDGIRYLGGGTSAATCGQRLVAGVALRPGGSALTAGTQGGGGYGGESGSAGSVGPCAGGGGACGTCGRSGGVRGAARVDGSS